MADLPLLYLTGLVALAAGISVLALIVWARFSPDPDQAMHRMITQSQGKTVFLFDGLTLVDCTPPARRMMDDLARGGDDLQRLLRGLSARFVDLPKARDIVDTDFEADFEARDPLDGIKLRFDGWNGFLRASLTHGAPELIQPVLTDASDELSTLRAMSDAAPFLMWQTDEEGAIDWANEAYMAELRRDAGPRAEDHWPPAPLFPDLDPAASDDTPQRVSQAGDGKTAQVFDIHSTQRGDGRLYFAIPADATMKAEAAQRDFVQTLTKTFAHLSIGLAIFDKERKLVLFNPALLDLMSLPVEFLSQQPTLTGFLDRLREERLIAEPRNYKAWRKRIVDLEAQAVDGSYCETWSLPGGVTFRVTGRPHPGGAIAFLFEDISAEMSLTRRFHAEIELGHAALDAVDEAIVIITTSGIVTLTNAPYREMWNSDADERVIPLRLREAVSLWRNEGDPEDPVWHALIDAVEQRNGPSAWHGQMTMADGRLLFCRTKRLTGGATLVGFKGPKPAAQNAPIATSDAAIEQREAG